jgi:aspartate/methionine/tyrosine aminotransferase
VLIGTGAKPFLFFGVLATCEPGARAVIPDPGFPIYESAVRWAGAVPVPVGLRADAGFALDLDALADALREPTALVILNSPHNPTGGVLGADDLRAVASLVAGTDAWVLSDEVYGRIQFAGDFASIASLPGMRERTLVVDSMSKSFAMTGWRCGYAAVPRALRDPLERFIVNSTSCVPPFVQLAAVAALRGPAEPVERMVGELRERCRLVTEGLDALPGISCAMPGGAFYAFPDVRGVPLAAERLAALLLEEAGVAVLAGSAFGAGGAGHLRLSCAAGRERLAEAVARVGATLDAL